MKDISKNVLKMIMTVIGLVAIVLFATIVLGHAARQENIRAQKISDEISVTELVNGLQAVKASEAGYGFTVPHDWSIEKRNSGNSAVYVGEHEVSSSSRCKIEISVFENIKKEPLESWIPVHIAEDPTLVIASSSLGVRTIANTSAMQWIGMIDDRKTILVYIPNDAKIYEVAPSYLGNDDGSVDRCLGYLETLLENFERL